MKTKRKSDKLNKKITFTKFRFHQEDRLYLNPYYDYHIYGYKILLIFIKLKCFNIFKFF